MKIRQLRKAINQGQYLGKYRQPKIDGKIFITLVPGGLVYTCGKIKLTERNGIQVWELGDKLLKVQKIL